MITINVQNCTILPEAQLFTVEASDLCSSVNGYCFEPSKHKELNLFNPKTNKQVVFRLAHCEERDNEVKFWDYYPNYWAVADNPKLMNWVLRIYND